VTRRRHATARVAIILLASCVMCFAARAPQGEIGDATLEAASGAHVVRVRVGAIASARIVNVPVELYVARVLAGEGEPTAPDAAQQALAVAIRTFAAANAGRHRRDGFDLCDATHCQVLRASTPAARRAALATAGQVLTFDGRPAEVFYSASCGGRSESASAAWPGAADRPYLRSSDDDVHADDAAWSVEVPLARVEQVLRGAGFGGRHLADVRVERRSSSGRVTLLELPGLQPSEITGDDLRTALGSRELRSTRFTTTRIGSRVRFTGQGYGHGVGLCVIGAGRRARRGDTVTQILAQYYPGVRLEPPAPVAIAAAARDLPAAGEPPADATEAAARRMRDELAARLGVTASPVEVRVHESLDSFRRATGRPWWVTVAVNGSAIDMAPPAPLAEREDVDAAMRRGVAEALLWEALDGKPAWMRIGAAQYFARSTPPDHASSKKAPCPSDAELTMAVSAAAQRDAETRAEACFARAFAKGGDWRNVR
jgi:stage II sporulation protein D